MQMLLLRYFLHSTLLCCTRFMPGWFPTFMLVTDVPFIIPGSDPVSILESATLGNFPCISRLGLVSILVLLACILVPFGVFSFQRTSHASVCGKVVAFVLKMLAPCS
jgi:hypothetical protein